MNFNYDNIGELYLLEKGSVFNNHNKNRKINEEFYNLN
jgi:hypothetical protein